MIPFEELAASGIDRSTASRGEKWSGFKEGGETEAEKPFKPSIPFTTGSKHCPDGSAHDVESDDDDPHWGPQTA